MLNIRWKNIIVSILIAKQRHLKFFVYGVFALGVQLSAVSAQNQIFSNPLGDEITPSGLLQLILRILLGLIGFVAVIYLIWAGFKYVTAGGDSKKAGEAKEGITHAIIGLIVAFVGFLLVELVYSLLGVGQEYGPGTLPSEIDQRRTGGGGNISCSTQPPAAAACPDGEWVCNQNNGSWRCEQS